MAEHTGLSLPTVWQILSGRDARYAEATKQRVLAAAAELGFRPNQAAKSLSEGRFGAVALLMGTLGYRSEVPAGMLGGIQDALDKDDRHLVFSRIDDERIRAGTRLPKILRQQLCDGILVNFTMHVPGGLEPLLKRLGIPAVWLNCKRARNAVHPDDYAAGASAADALLAQGHRHVVVATSHETPHYSWHDRRDGACEALRAGSARVTVIDHQDGHRAWCARLHELLRSDQRPTAIIGYRPIAVLPALSLAAELGLSVPDDLSLVTFDDQAPTGYDRLISCLPIPAAAEGRAAVAMLDRCIATPGHRCARVAVPFGPIVGDTIAPPRSQS